MPRLWQSMMWLGLIFIIFIVFTGQAGDLHPFLFWGLVVGVVLCSIFDAIEQDRAETAAILAEFYEKEGQS